MDAQSLEQGSGGVALGQFARLTCEYEAAWKSLHAESLVAGRFEPDAAG